PLVVADQVDRALVLLRGEGQPHPAQGRVGAELSLVLHGEGGVVRAGGGDDPTASAAGITLGDDPDLLDQSAVLGYPRVHTGDRGAVRFGLRRGRLRSVHSLHGRKISTKTHI